MLTTSSSSMDLQRSASYLAAMNAPAATRAPTQETSPMESANLLSYWTFAWVSPLIKKGYAKSLGLADLLPLPQEMLPEVALAAFNAEWAKEIANVGEEQASLAWCMFRTYKRDFFLTLLESNFFIAAAILVGTILDLFALTLLFHVNIGAPQGPAVFMRMLVQYAATPSDGLLRGLLLLLGVVLSEVFRSLLVHMMWFRSSCTAVNYRTIVYGLVYQKALSMKDLAGYSVGELVNICSNDGQRVADAAMFSMFFYISAVMGLGVLAFSWAAVGPSAIAGVAVFFLMFPLQIYVGNAYGSLRRRAIGQTDRRVRMMNELLTSIKLIKMYAWEVPLCKAVMAIRTLERSRLRPAAYLQSFTVSLGPLIPVLAGVATFVIATYSGDSLSAADVFSVMACYNALRFSLAVLPLGVKAYAEAAVGMQRLRDFMGVKCERQSFEAPVDAGLALELIDATCGWSLRNELKLRATAKQTVSAAALEKAPLAPPSDGVSGGGKATGSEAVHPAPLHYIALKRANLCVPHGTLLGVCGSVGSGKSSLLSALLGQMDVVGGSIRTRGRMGYVAQQAWIESTTLENNILFGKPRVQELLDRAVFASGLTRDLEILPAGIQTEIGERGINLSGGQKQRVSLARALYSDSDVYLLDDPLSAVDAHVGKHIFTHYIRGALAGKTVVFVTHALQYLSRCDRVVFVEDGALHHGTFEELRANNTGFQRLLELVAAASVSDTDEIPPSAQSATAPPAAPVQSPTPTPVPEPTSTSTLPSAPFTHEQQAGGRVLVKAEIVEQGAVGCGGLVMYFLILVTFVVAMGCKAFSDWWLGHMVGIGDGKHSPSGPGSLSDNPRRWFYLLIYGITGVALLVAQVLRGWWFNWASLRSSSGLHNQMFSRVMHAPMSFFDTTPTGRILNRFSQDLDEVDVRLPFSVEQFLQNGTLIVITLGLIAVLVPWFLIGLAAVAVYFFGFVHYFGPAQRQIKRLDNVARSPLFSHLTATLQGLVTINAFGRREMFMASFYQKMDMSTRAYFAFLFANRWFAWRLNFSTTIIIACTGATVVAMHGSMKASVAGLILLYAGTTGGIMQYTTRLYAECESRFSSVERICNYIVGVPIERVAVAPPVLPLHWPQFGAIRFENVSARYRDELPLVLQQITMSIGSCEKIGIAGATGCGKSSLSLSIFRIIEACEGRIYIDDVDIATLELEQLRSRLAIIPQDPVLFIGTLRYNLDPFDQFSDEELWKALKQAHVDDMVRSLPDKMGSFVVENGDNFSVGERQLICMARALLRNSKILIMDEATASIDAATDNNIQATIREAFKHCTVLTIAHRLDTILDADRILVLNAGSIAEFDKPSVLLANEASHLSKLVKSARSSKPRS